MSPAKMLIIFGCNEYPKKITSSITGQRSRDLQLQAVGHADAVPVYLFNIIKPSFYIILSATAKFLFSVFSKL